MGANVPRVLIADSDLNLRQQLFGALLDHDIYSDCVSNVAEALTKLGDEAYSVVILDMALPLGDIDDVIAHIAAMPFASRPIVLVLAANPIEARSLDVEIVQIVLRRPLYLRQLVDVVRNCVQNTAQRAAVSAKRDGDQVIS